MVGNDGGKKGVVGREEAGKEWWTVREGWGMGEGVVGREGWEREWRAGKDRGESSGQGGMGEGVVDSEGGDKEMVGNEGGGWRGCLLGILNDDDGRRRRPSSVCVASLRCH